MSDTKLGHSTHSQQGHVTFGSTWTVFGPVERKDPLVADADLATTPRVLTVGGRRLRARTVRAVKGVGDLAPLLGGTKEGRTAYVFIPLTAPRAGEFHVGIGADWWFQAWVDGKPIGDTLRDGNRYHPISADDKSLTVPLAAGAHTLAIRFISGSGSSRLAVGVPTLTGAERDAAYARRQSGIADRVSRPLKVVFLGAGSGFLQGLFTDLLNLPGADEGELALVDIDPARLALAKQLCDKIVAAMGRHWTITATTDRRTVLPGANYIINCIEVSGVQCVAHDNDIPLKYGIDQCIGDTTGPGGLFKALRTVPVFLDALRDVARYCPAAWVLNYTNPMSILCLAAARAVPQVQVVGLCHSVQGASHALAGWTGVPYCDLKWTCAGVNHLAWFTELSHQGRDLYPALKARVARDPKFAEGDLVRFDLMNHFGYYCTESSGHDSEYLPYYRKNRAVRKLYCRAGYRGGSRFYASNWPAWRQACDQRRRDQISGAAPIPTARGWEYASYIIQAGETNTPVVIYGNVPNRGLISNLPQDGVVEVACLVDRYGIRPTHYGALPAQCAALCDWNMRFFDLAATACIEKSKAAAAHALMLDPLTAAVSYPAAIKQMTEELFAAEKDFLPGYR